MIYLIAIIQGIVEGLTEFLPISSTGHLILSGHLLEFTDDRAKTFEIVIQLAAILAVVTLYFQKFLRFIPTSKNNKQKGFNGIHAIKTLLITSLPAVIAGFLLHDFVKDQLFKPLTVAVGLFIGGILLIFYERFVPKPDTKELDKITGKQALGVGLAQIFSIWPGVSRAASTIVGGSFLKLDRKTAVEYSFFAAVPVMVGATALDLVKSMDNLSASDLPLFIIGMVVSYITAMLAITYLLKYVQKHSLAIFGYYRIILAIIVILVLVK